MAEFPSLTHVALTVTDLDRSRAWYRRLFGVDPVLDENTGPYHHVVWLLGGTLFGIRQHARP
jgi:glyoxylase I family protein